MPQKRREYRGERKRGCGYRVVGGLYLIGGVLSRPCDRLPYELGICPTCGAGVHFSRGFQWLDWRKFAGEHKQQSSLLAKILRTQNCICPDHCALCHPGEDAGKYGLFWVGKKHYPTPDDFIREAGKIGVSKRIAHVPKELVLGKTWVLLAHPEAVPVLGEKKGKPGIFQAFIPQRIEKIITRDQATEEELKKLDKQGITPVIVDEAQCTNDMHNGE